MLQIGTRAPEFTATLDNGEIFKLSDQRGKNNVVLYFYPKDETPGCTKEACAFRDNYDVITAHDAIIVGVSTDSAESHQKFRDHHSLPFPLIADTKKELTGLYGARGLFGMMTSRVTYVIDKEGVIRGAFKHEMIGIHNHITDAVGALEAIAAGERAATT